jgi:sec-independent protein translocase protein TatB
MSMPPATIQMANLGMADSLILMVMALVVFGPRRLPQIGRQIGKLMYEFRKASNDFKFQMEEELRVTEDADRRKKEQERVAALALAAPTSLPETLPAPVKETTMLETAQTPPVEVAAAEATTAESAPLIHPPATGEPVAADRPNRYRAPQEEAAASATELPHSASALEVPVEVEAASAPEQAAHHG